MNATQAAIIVNTWKEKAAKARQESMNFTGWERETKYAGHRNSERIGSTAWHTAMSRGLRNYSYNSLNWFFSLKGLVSHVSVTTEGNCGNRYYRVHYLRNLNDNTGTTLPEVFKTMAQAKKAAEKIAYPEN